MAVNPKKWEFAVSGEIRNVALSGKGEYIAATSSDNYLYFLNGSGDKLWELNLEVEIVEMHISITGDYLLALSADNSVQLYDKEGKVLWSSKFSSVVGGTAISSTAGYIVAGCEDGTVNLFTREGKGLWKYKCVGGVNDISIAKDGSYIVAGDDEGNVYLLDLRGRFIWAYKTLGVIERVKLSGNGEYVFASADDFRTYFFQRGGNLLWNPRNVEIVRHVDISESGKKIILAVGNEVYLLDESGMVIKRFQALGLVLGVAISMNGEYAVASTTNNNVYFFDKVGELLWKFDALGDCEAVAIDAQGDCVVGGSNDRRIYFFDNYNFFEGVISLTKKNILDIKEFGVNTLEADVLLNRAIAEVKRREYASAITYAKGAESLAKRIKEKCKPEISILVAVNEGFHLNHTQLLNILTVNTGTAHANNIKILLSGNIVVQEIEKIGELQVGKYKTIQLQIKPTASGIIPVKLSASFHDLEGRSYLTETIVDIAVGEAGKRTPYTKLQPIIKVGNVQRLLTIASVKTSVEKEVIPDEYLCPKCKKTVKKEFLGCPYCFTKLR
ncbi:MAG: PQQ-binding-like beta-propeller repeat protein [Candidatus Thermoplasmatota archaeon]